MSFEIFIIISGATLWIYLMLLYNVKKAEATQTYIDDIHRYKLDISINYPANEICSIVISNTSSHFEFTGKNLNGVVKSALDYVELNADKFKPPKGY